MAKTRRGVCRGVHRGGTRTQRPSKGHIRTLGTKRAPKGVPRATNALTETVRPRSSRAALMAAQRLLQPITAYRTRILGQQRTAKIPRAHTYVEYAKSPEALHAIVTRLASLPAQPILHFTVPDVTSIETPYNVHMKNPIPANIVRDAPLANIVLRDPKKIEQYDEHDLILEEALHPTGVVYISNDEDNNNNNNGENENGGNENENGNGNNGEENQEGGGNFDDIDATISDVSIHPNLLSAVREDYSGVEKFDIPIYFVTYAPDVPGGGHMSILIVYKSVVYSLGFGYYAPLKAPKIIAGIPIGIPAKLLGKGTLYNPDYLIDPRRITEDKTIEWSYNIIDIGYCRPIHLTRIMEIAELKTSNIEITFGSRGNFKSTHIQLNVQYHAASCPSISKSVKGMLNCTTFVEYIFRETVNCALIPYMPLSISHPKKCKRKQGKITNEHIKKWYNEYGNASPMYSPAMHALLSAGF